MWPVPIHTAVVLEYLPQQFARLRYGDLEYNAFALR